MCTRRLIPGLSNFTPATPWPRAARGRLGQLVARRGGLGEEHAARREASGFAASLPFFFASGSSEVGGEDGVGGRLPVGAAGARGGATARTARAAARDRRARAAAPAPVGVAARAEALSGRSVPHLPGLSRDFDYFDFILEWDGMSGMEVVFDSLIFWAVLIV